MAREPNPKKRTVTINIKVIVPTIIFFKLSNNHIEIL
jgi:hypothetical protein